MEATREGRLHLHYVYVTNASNAYKNMIFFRDRMIDIGSALATEQE